MKREHINRIGAEEHAMSLHGPTGTRNKTATGEPMTVPVLLNSNNFPGVFAVIDDDTPEIVKQANAAMEQAANDVLLRARWHNTPIVAIA